MRSDSFTTSWLAARLGADPAWIDARRRAGELFAVPTDGDHLYPTWQFAAASRGSRRRRLDAFLHRRAGVGGPRMWELAREGRGDFVIASLRSAA